jgi:PAS domain S-box-containing protein
MRTPTDILNTLRNKKSWEDFFSLSNVAAHRSEGKTADWSDKEAELISHFEIFNHSALLSVSDLRGNITYANELFCRISKYSINELLNKPHSIVRHPDTPDAIFKEMWSTIGRGEVWQGEIKNKAKDGSDYWVIATVAPVMGPNKKPIRYISVRYDITKQKQTEEELKQANKKIDKELFENIAYAKHIHSIFLGGADEIDLFDDSFLIYRAQKIISGDFYKMERQQNKLMLVVGDSTGHGISASYISVLVLNILSRAMHLCCDSPDKVLKIINSELNKITRPYKKEHLIESADMMACCIDHEKMNLIYASAKMKAFIIREKEIILLDKDKCTIGELPECDFKIACRNVPIQKGDCFYIISDGLTDQFGGSFNKRIGFKNVLSLIKESQDCPMVLQKQIIENMLLEWQGNCEQTDDITIFGVRI